MPGPTSPPAPRRAFTAVLLVNFVDTLGFSLVLPFLVFVVTRLGGNAFIYGLMSATYPACALVSAPVLGRWSDRYGRKRVLLLCEAGTVLGWVVLAVALSLPANPLASVAWRLTGPFTLTLPLLLVFLARADVQLIAAGALMLCANFLLLLTTNLVAVGASVVLFALGNGVMWPSAVALLSKVAGEERQGVVQGVASSVGSLASIAGLITGGLVFGTLGAGTFALAAALITVAGALALPLRGQPR